MTFSIQACFSTNPETDIRQSVTASKIIGGKKKMVPRLSYSVSDYAWFMLAFSLLAIATSSVNATFLTMTKVVKDHSVDVVSDGGVASSGGRTGSSTELVAHNKSVRNLQVRNPTRKPTRRPSRKPTRRPSRKPTRRPSRKPTRKPSRKPTRKPSRKPSRKPTRKPSRKPTRKPSRKPTRKPSRKPTRKPSRRPSRKLTHKPTRKPSRRPSREPSRKTTRAPTNAAVIILPYTGTNWFGDKSSSFECPYGERLINLEGAATPAFEDKPDFIPLNYIVGTCEGGKALGPIGGPGTASSIEYKNPTCTGGYYGAKVFQTFDGFTSTINFLEVYCETGQYASIRDVNYDQLCCGRFRDFEYCPENMYITGFGGKYSTTTTFDEGRYGGIVYRLYFICRSSNRTRKPTQKPSGRSVRMVNGLKRLLNLFFP